MSAKKDFDKRLSRIELDLFAIEHRIREPAHAPEVDPAITAPARPPSASTPTDPGSRSWLGKPHEIATVAVSLTALFVALAAVMIAAGAIQRSGPREGVAQATSRPVLVGAQLPLADLQKANLARADLTKADLSGANLRSARFDRADLSGANLAGADLSRASLQGAELVGCNLEGALLTDVDLRGANLRRARLEHARVGSASWLEDLAKLTPAVRGFERQRWFVASEPDDSGRFEIRSPLH